MMKTHWFLFKLHFFRAMMFWSHRHFWTVLYIAFWYACTVCGYRMDLIKKWYTNATHSLLSTRKQTPYRDPKPHKSLHILIYLKWVAMQCGHKTLVPLQSIIWLQKKHLHNKLIYCSTTWDSKHKTQNWGIILH